MGDSSNYRFETDYRKKGKVLIAKSHRSAKIAGAVGVALTYKEKEVYLYPTKLVYKHRDDSEEIFLLGPLEFTEMKQIEDTILKLVSYPEKKLDVKNSMAVFDINAGRGHKMLMQFASRVEREEWMKLIIEECTTNYLEDLISLEGNCTPKFLRLANEELWFRILSKKGDENLRSALAANPGSDHIELVRMIAAVVIDWLKVVLKTEQLFSYHKEVFAVLFSFLLENICARALFILLRPDEHFLDDFSVVCKAFVLDENNKGTPEDQQQRLHYLSGFLRLMVQTLRSESWQKFSVFLSIVNHPALPANHNGNITLKEIDHLTELKWIKEYWSQCTEATWSMFKFGLSDSPYFSFYFVQKEILEKIDDQRARKVLYLMQRVPEDQRDMEFEADRVLIPKRKHFETLTNFCKYREVWKIFCIAQRRERLQLFFNEVHKEIWNRMAVNEQKELKSMFLPTNVTHTMPTLLEVLSGEIVKTVNVDLLKNLQIRCSKLPQTVNEDGLSAIDSVRNYLVGRVCQWVKLIGKGSLSKEDDKIVTKDDKDDIIDDAKLYVNLLIACAKSAVVRAVICLILPPRCERTGADQMLISSETVMTSLEVLSAMSAEGDCKLLSQAFLSFLIIAEHPLAKQVVETSMLTALSDAGAKLTWSDESSWMKSVHAWSHTWNLSMNELKLFLSGTPYFALQILLRRLSLDKGNFSHLSVLITKLPLEVKQVSFKADVNMSVEVRFQASVEREAQHFLDFLDCRRIREIWRVIQTDLLTLSTEFEEETLLQLLTMIIDQRSTPGQLETNAFQKMMTRLNAPQVEGARKIDVMSASFEYIIQLLLEMQINSKDEVLSSLFPTLPVRVFTPPETESLKWSNAQLKSFLEYLGKFCADFRKDHLNEHCSSDFVQVFVSCLDNMVMRAMLLLVKPVCKTKGALTLAQVVNYFTNNQNHVLTLYLLKLLKHPGVQEVKTLTASEPTPVVVVTGEILSENDIALIVDGVTVEVTVSDSPTPTEDGESVKIPTVQASMSMMDIAKKKLEIVPISWKDESEWLWKVEESFQMHIDEVDFSLVSNPAYLLLRHVTREFAILDNAIIHKTLNQLSDLSDLISLDVAFKAQVNYYPCIHSLVQSGLAIASTLINAPHFEQIRSYCLYHQIWQLLMPQFLLPTAEVDFVDAVVWKLWTNVSRKPRDVEDYTEMSKVFCPNKDCIMDWIKDDGSVVTYSAALQKYALLKIVQFVDKELVSKVIPTFVPPEIVIVFDSEVEAHKLLMERINLWMHALLDPQRPTHEWYAAIFTVLLEAALADVAFRVLLVCVTPNRSVVADFMKERNLRNTGPAVYAQGALKFLEFVYETVEDDEWFDLRAFMNIVELPVASAGSLENEAPLDWKIESEWIMQRCMLKPAVMTWKEFSSSLTPNNPYILLLLMTRCLSTPEQQYIALSKIPERFLGAKFKVEFASNINRIGDSQHFINMCLTGSLTFTNATAAADAGETGSAVVSPLSVFKERSRVNDDFFRALLREACMDPSNPRSLQVYNLLQTTLFDANGGWNMDVLKLVPNISSVIITFLHEMSQKRELKLDEMIVGCLIMLVLQLESCNTNKEVVDSCVLASAWMRHSNTNKANFFSSLDKLNFHKWFHRLVGKNGGVYGPLSSSFKIRDDGIREQFENNMVLNDSMSLNKTKLTKSIIGYYCLCAEFAPENGPDWLHIFATSLGNGRPFFTNFLHSKEFLGRIIPPHLCRIMGIAEGTGLYKRIINKELYYDNDHATVESLNTLRLRQSNRHCQKLTDEEFSNLLTVAWYTHDLKNLSIRFEAVAVSLLNDPAKRSMANKIIAWIIEMFITPDVKTENDPANKDSNDRLKWKHCEKFTSTTFEDIIDCAAQATVSAHLLKDNPKTLTTLEMLFKHYLEHSPPTKWRDNFIGCKTIAFFIKYVDSEDLGLAFQKFYSMNSGNKLFLKHLLIVRKLLLKPIVSGKDLVVLMTSAAGEAEENNRKFFQKLMKTGNEMRSVDIKLVYRLTSCWMKISKKKILFPLPPRNAQIITLLTVANWARMLLTDKNKEIGKALIGQVGTGEGKSLIIAMTAIYFVKVLNKRVHILENNPGLLEKDVATMRPLYKEFGIEARAEGEASEEKRDLTFTTPESLNSKDVRNEFCKFGITYTLRRNVERYYQDCIMNGESRPMKDTVLIVDEVDDLIVDKNPNQPFASADCQKKEYQQAFEHFKDYSDPPPSREDNMIWGMAQGQVSAANDMVANRDYAEIGSDFVLLDANKRPIKCYDGRLEYLKYKYRNKAPVLKTCYYVQSIPYMLSQYSAITGFSGSLGSPAERKFLTEQYKVWCFDTPNFLNTCIGVTKVPPTLMSDPSSGGQACVHVFPTAETQMNKVIEIAMRMYMKVPVLIIAKNTAEAYSIETKIRLSLQSQQGGFRAGDKVDDFVQMFMEMKKDTVVLDSANWGTIVQRATDKKEKDRYCITITDPFGGRGHDFDVNDDAVNDAGGLLVIMTSLPESEREWRQWKGRTGRKDTRGQYALVMNRQDPLLAANGPILSSCQLSVGDGKLFKEDLIQKLLDKQDEGTMTKLAAMEKDIKRGKRLNRLCDQFYARFGVMKEETWPFQHQIKLRNLLIKYALNNLTEDDINTAFQEWHLEEVDSQALAVITPDEKNAAFWSVENQQMWTKLEKQAEQGMIEEIESEADSGTKTNDPKDVRSSADPSKENQTSSTDLVNQEYLDMVL